MIQVDYNIIKKIKFFQGIEKEELQSMLSCLEAKIIKVKKDNYILRAGEEIHSIGLVLSGEIQIIREDMNGTKVLLALLGEGEIFGETFCSAGMKESPVNVLAHSKVEIMLLNFTKILYTCSNNCMHHEKLISNMLQIIAKKNIEIQNRMEFISKKTIRLKLLSYFAFMAKRQGHTFKIPYNREELADYLCIDRSALSRELGYMKKEGMIDFEKNKFCLKKLGGLE